MIDIIHHQRWLDNATAGLNFCLREALPILKQQVNDGIAQLWELTSTNGKSWMISRAEEFNGSKELVVCCYQGCDLKQIAPMIAESAELDGFISIRFHTHRKGLNRLIVDLGFTPHETVYKKILNQSQGEIA